MERDQSKLQQIELWDWDLKTFDTTLQDFTTSKLINSTSVSSSSKNRENYFVFPTGDSREDKIVMIILDNKYKMFWKPWNKKNPAAFRFGFTTLGSTCAANSWDFWSYAVQIGLVFALLCCFRNQLS